MKFLRNGKKRADVFKKACKGALALPLSLLLTLSLVMLSGRVAFAADEEYTYTVRLYPGNQGTLTGEGIQAPASANIAYGDDRIVISGLKYGDSVYIVYQDAVNVTDERYYARGVRRSGRDNSEATASSFTVASDRDYVIAYGVKGDMVAYTVNYLDANGNRLLTSDTYYGAAGERQYVSARYVDGYQPQALNLVKTLSANEAENVFDFQYTRVQSAGDGTGGTGTTGGTGGTGTTGGDGAGDGAGIGGANGAGDAAGGAGTDGAGGPGGAADGAGVGGAGGAGADGASGADADAEGGAIGGDLTAVPDEDVPQNLVDLDDDDVPLENKKLQDSAGIMVGYMPFYIGIGVVAVAALIIMAIFLRKRKKPQLKSIHARKGESEKQPIDDEK